MAEGLKEFPELTINTKNDKEIDIIETTCLVANMPVAAHEASIYTGITSAEYFRDQDLNVAMIANSTSKSIKLHWFKNVVGQI